MLNNIFSPFVCATQKTGRIHRQFGVSLIELILFIVIISIALAGILLVMNNVTGRSADTLIRKQALAIGESLLEEIQLQDFISQFGATNKVTTANRATEYHIVNDYDPFSMAAGIKDMNGNTIAGLTSYSAIVGITSPGLGGIGGASAVFITVTVTDPQNNTVNVSGYRTAHF